MLARDKFGNDGADLLAVEGAASHSVPPGIVARAHARKAAAKGLHRMMLDIVAFRRGCELALRGELLAEDEIPEFEDAGALEFDEPVVAFGMRVPVDTDPG